ncbi:type II secretion system protein, partial [Vibrio parahaemolyticus]|nr:type II secretion system protein [Vibrio parahaemolyticus]
GTQPYIALGLGKIFISKDYQLTGSQKPYLLSQGSDYWQVGLEVRVKSLLTGKLDKIHTGEITAFTQCK